MTDEFEEFAHVYPVNRKYQNKYFAGSISDDDMEEVLWDREKWFETYEGILNKIGQHLENHRIKYDEDDGKLEMRARINEIPIRISWWLDIDDISYPDSVMIEMKFAGRIKELNLNWDPERMPKGKDREWEVDWEEEDDNEVRVFVAKAIYIEGDESYVNRNLKELNSLSEELRRTIYRAMWSIPIADIDIRQGSESIDILFEKNIIMLENPVEDINRIIDLLVEITKVIKVDWPIDEPEETDEEGPLFERVICTYCATSFIIGMNSSCPNCGAPHSG